MRINFDKWGYPPGGLKAAILSLLPNPPSLITADQLARELHIISGTRTTAFLKAVQRKLAQLRKERRAHSGLYEQGSNKLGWARTSGIRGSVLMPAIAPVPRRSILRSRRSDGGSPIGMHLQEKVLVLLPVAPAACTSNDIANTIELACRLGAGEAMKAVEAQLANLEKMGLARSQRSASCDDRIWSRSTSE